MSYEQPTRDELALHEAGHAYAYASLVQREEPVELGLGIDSAGFATGWCKRRSLLLAGVRPEALPPEVLAHLEWQSRAEIVIAMAGPVAEFRHRHRSRAAGLRALLAIDEEVLSQNGENVDGDFSRVRDVIDALRPADEKRFLTGLIGIADAIVSTDWHRIKLLAGRLSTAGLLGEDDLCDWFDRHPATTYRHVLT